MLLASDPDLSDNFNSEDEEDVEEDDSDDAKTEEEDEKSWYWSEGEGPVPIFDTSIPVEGKPISLPDIAADMAPVHFFFQMLPKKMIEKIVEETNQYASQKLHAVSPESKARWRPVDESDIYRFLAIIISMGIVRVRRKKDLWCDSNPEVLRLPSVQHVMPMRRFMEIKRFLHLENNAIAAPPGSDSYDPLHKIRKLYECLQSRFRNGWKMGTFASVDESMTTWKGKSRFKQYMRSKPIRWGYKFFCICDSKTGYIKDFELYLGKRTVGEQFGLCTDIVLKLAERSRLSSTKSIVVADNYYSSPTLVALLAQKGVGYIGTCQLSRKNVPRTITQQNQRAGATERGTTKTAFIEMKTIHQLASDATIYMCSWRDTKIANFIGSAEGLSMTTLTRRNRDGVVVNVPAPKIVKTYTERMGGVDLADQNKARYSISATVITRKWWVRLFSGLLDMALTNSWQLYKYTVEEQKRLSHQDFLFAVADGFLAEARASLERRPAIRGLVPVRHELVHQQKRSRCVVCSTPRRLKRTIWMCSLCMFAMHAEKCFQEYHTQDKKISSRFHTREVRLTETY